jgi:transporter family-2 protein
MIVTASTVTSLILDHFGLMRFVVHQANIGRVMGALLMLAGVALVAIY